MGTERGHADRGEVYRTILLIDEDAAVGAGRISSIEECEEQCIVTTHTTEQAFSVLGTLWVDVIFNFSGTAAAEEGRRFRDRVAEHFPRVRLVDPWTPAPLSGKVLARPLPPLYLRPDLACDVRKRRMEEAA